MTRNEMKERLSRSYRNNIVLVKFYLLFGYFLLMLYFCLHFESTHHLVADKLPALVAACVTWTLGLLGQDAQAYGATISVQGGMSFRIIYHCTGVFLMSIYAAAILAYPARAREKALGLILGLPILFATNVLRLAVLGIIGRYSPQYFDLSHEYLWQGIFIVFVLVLWVQWRDRLVSGPPPLALSG